MAAAVVVHGAYKYYGGNDDRKVVLDGLNMTVERGTIYGLLGPSGCGKTTLLSCIVGRRKLNSGDIWVLGGKPGSKGSGVPGPRIGYMPQDIALVAEFTVKDAVYYFGRIFGMSTKAMRERFLFLSELLELPPEGRLLKNLSGGQQRRVSFAAALVQEPELLILDEPTVGLDPVLREKIWDYLVLVAEMGTTVIITTHYIDETKQANKIGLLRGGQLLAEESPAALLQRFGAATLEEAFLALAHRQQSPLAHTQAILASPDLPPRAGATNSTNYDSREDFTRICNASTDALERAPQAAGGGGGTARGRYRAVFIKSIQQFARHPGGLIFAMMFPLIQVVAFFSAVGHDPRSLSLGVVNHEAANSPYGLSICQNTSLVSALRVDEDSCDLYMASCRFIAEMEENDIHQVTYSSLDTALEAVRRGELYGAIFVASNFSSSLQTRFKEGTDIEEGPLNASTINIWLDMTNHQISLYVRAQLFSAYERFARRLMTECGFVADLAQIPVRFSEPIYGDREPKYSTFMAPGAMMTILFFLAATITSTLLISDRLEGVWERSAVAGVKPHELLTVHIAIHSAVILLQTVEMMLLAFVGYGLPFKGQLLTIFMLLFLQGLSGMCYGFLLSVCCSSYTLAFFISTGSFYPMILLCGILWPLEGMSAGLRLVALMLPFTIPSISFRDLMLKGFTILHREVYSGFLVTIAWITVTLLLCLASLRWRKN